MGPPSLNALPLPEAMPWLYWAVGATYALAGLAAVLRPGWGRAVLAAGALAHLGATVWRGVLIEFFPLTNKFESFSAAALFLAWAAVLAWRPRRLFALPLCGLLVVTMYAALSFPLAPGYPPPLMRTIWYPLHVPLSFAAYAIWTVAAANALLWLHDRDPGHLQRIDRHALQGFAMWSLGMVCGGFWGVVAWGAYFLWDPKIIWSVILWFFYATFTHVHLTPSLQRHPWVRPALALVGFVFVLVAYVGTSFLFGRSSHAFG